MSRKCLVWDNNNKTLLEKDFEIFKKSLKFISMQEESL